MIDLTPVTLPLVVVLAVAWLGRQFLEGGP